MNVDFIILDAETGALLQFGQYPEQDFWALEGEGKIALAFPASGIAQTVAEGGTLIGLDLAVLKPLAIARVNRQAGEFRTKFITSIPGQEAVYLLKQQEAKAWAVGADPADFPYLAAEAAATGVTVADLVASVLAISAAWGVISPAIEAARRGAITAIDAASSTPAVVAAMQVDWQALIPA